MSFRVNDLPFLLKVSLAPAFAFIVLIFLAVYANFGLGQATSGIEKILEENMALSRQVSVTNNDFKQLDGGIYQLLTFYAADGESMDLEAEVEKINAQAEKVSAGLTVIKEKFAGSVDMEEMATVEDALQTYVEAIDVVTQMLEIDFASAVSFAEPFKANAEKVTAIFDKLANGANTSAASNASVIQENVSGIQSALLFGTIVAGLLVAGISFLIGKMTTKSIQEIAGATTRVASGDTEFDIHALERKDELGSVVEALEQFSMQMAENAALQAQQEEMRAKTEAEDRKRAEEKQAAEEQARIQKEQQRLAAEEDRKRAMNNLADGFDRSVTTVISTVQSSAAELDNSASSVQERAKSNTQLCDNVSRTAEDVSSGMQTVATATEELSSSIDEIARQMERSSQEVNDTVKQTDDTNKVVLELASSADKIGEVVNMINDIAAQTNLLALNATIEAARAGDAGRGFAVVASEVKTLAGQTAKATDEIATQIKNVQSVTGTVVDSMKVIGQKIDNVSEIATSVAAAIEEQTGATGEIARTVSVANDQVQSLAADSEELTLSANDNVQSATDLSKIVFTLKKEFDELEKQSSGFVSEIRSN